MFTMTDLKDRKPQAGTKAQRQKLETALTQLERSLATLVQVLAGRATVGDIARRSGHDLPPASWALLEHLDSFGTLCVSDIAACHRVDVSSITPRLKSLENAGLLARSTLPSDARVSLIDITAAGKKALESVHVARREIIADALGGEIEVSQIALASDVLGHIVARLSVEHPAHK